MTCRVWLKPAKLEANQKEREGKLRTLLSMAEDLEDSLQSNDDFDPLGARQQYRTLRDRLKVIEPDAEHHLPDIEISIRTSTEQDRTNVLVMVGQMLAYLGSKVEPEAPKEQVNVLSLSGPLNLLLMLESSGLTIKWAVSATALSLIEVITNRKLAQLKLETTGEFDKRLNRLKNALKNSGVEIPDLLLSGLYKVRSKVIHEGREPSKEELDLILNILDSYFRKIS